MGNIEINVLNSVKEKERERLRTGTFRPPVSILVQPQRWDAPRLRLPGLGLFRGPDEFETVGVDSRRLRCLSKISNWLASAAS